MLTYKIIRLPIVKEMTGLSETAIWRREQDGRFPLRRHLGGRAVGWIYDEVVEWIKSTRQKQATRQLH